MRVNWFNESSLTHLDYVVDFFGSFVTTSMSRSEIQMKTNILLPELTMCGFLLNSEFEVSKQHFCALGCWAFLEEQRLFPKVTQVWKIMKILLYFIQENIIDIQSVEGLVGKLGNVCPREYFPLVFTFRRLVTLIKRQFKIHKKITYSRAKLQVSLSEEMELLIYRFLFFFKRKLVVAGLVGTEVGVARSVPKNWGLGVGDWEYV